MTKLYNKVIEDWTASYLQEDHKDPHQIFADLQGISRQSAKVLCYRVIWQSKFMKNVLNNI